LVFIIEEQEDGIHWRRWWSCFPNSRLAARES
jgi:hypothetical protein